MDETKPKYYITLKEEFPINELNRINREAKISLLKSTLLAGITLASPLPEITSIAALCTLCTAIDSRYRYLTRDTYQELIKARFNECLDYMADYSFMIEEELATEGPKDYGFHNLEEDYYTFKDILYSNLTKLKPTTNERIAFSSKISVLEERIDTIRGLYAEYEYYSDFEYDPKSEYLKITETPEEKWWTQYTSRTAIYENGMQLLKALKMGNLLSWIKPRSTRKAEDNPATQEPLPQTDKNTK